jgi:hypothetical protein
MTRPTIAPGFIKGHAGFEVSLDLRFQMEAQLVFQVAVEAIATQEKHQPLHQAHGSLIRSIGLPRNFGSSGTPQSLHYG